MFKKGFEICECNKFAFIYASEIFQYLPSDYTGELCPQCNLWVCDVRHLTSIPANLPTNRRSRWSEINISDG